MATIFDCSTSTGLMTGMRLARSAVGRGELVVIPTDTVYGVAADAFNPAAVQRLLDAKGRTRAAPPPVLVPGIETLDALAEVVPDEVRALVAAFWPGGLTIILPARGSLHWDLGDTAGTVALRMPSDPVALELLKETGPLAVSSANLSGQPAAMTAEAAEEMLGDSIAVYLDNGSAGASYPAGLPSGTGSTIIDATGLTLTPEARAARMRAGQSDMDESGLRIVREGVIPAREIFAVLDAARAEAEPAAESTGSAATGSETTGSEATASEATASEADGPAAGSDSAGSPQ